MNSATKTLLCALVCALAMLGCEAQSPVVRVQNNVINKSILAGSWYMSRTVIDLQYEGSPVDFVGNNAGDRTGGNLGFSIPRVRWVIDQDFLYAYRDYETVADPEDPQRVLGDEDEDYLGQPIAAFAIESHFDIRRDYNPTTGEERNIIVENTTDNYWYERQFMRVDWSQNLIVAHFGNSANLSEVFGGIRRDTAGLFVQDQSLYPDEWAQQFHYMECDGLGDDSEGCTAAERDYAGDYDQGELYSMSFVTQEIAAPAFNPAFGTTLCRWSDQIAQFFPGAPECASVSIFIRTSFLKVSDRREYIPTAWTLDRFNRAGYFALDRPTFDRTSEAGDPAYWLRDFTNQSANRHNIWRNWYERDANGEIVRDDTGVPQQLSYTETDANGEFVRQVRPIVWYTSREVPAHLIKPSYELTAMWNRTLMETVRSQRGQQTPVYADVSCQSDDPGGYCFCQTAPDTGDVLNPTCPGLYDPFESPQDAQARIVSGEAFDCWVQVPEGSEPDWNDSANVGATDAAFNGWFGAEQTGSECVNELRINTCNLGNEEEWDSLDCQSRGDLRYKLLSFVNQPGTPFLGVAQLRGDPITGEIIFGDANIGAPAMDRQRTMALQTYDLIAGNITDEQFFIGEDVRNYLEALNSVELPAPPRIDFSAALRQGGLGIDEGFRAGLNNRMEQIMQRAEFLRGADGAANVYSDRLPRLAGSDHERRLYGNINEALVFSGVEGMPTNMTNEVMEELMAMGSPYRHSIRETLDDYTDYHLRLGLSNMIMPNQYVDASVLNFVREHEDWDRVRVEFEINRRLYRDTQVHEMGHCMGLRHHFGGTADVGNYFDGYYSINDSIPLPDPRDARYQLDGEAGFNSAEQELFQDDYNERKELRELAGIDQWMTSSVMDYTPNWYQRINGAGRHDYMAISYGYGDLVDIYDNNRAPDGSARAPLSIDRITPINTRREYVKWYVGGETCNADADCPFNPNGSRSGELLQSNIDSGLVQTCEPNPRTEGFRTCSGFDDDAQRLIEDGATDWVPVEYFYCEDIRANTRTLPGCATFDTGDSFREIVSNQIEIYERQYLFDAFRRYRRTFTVGSYASRIIRYIEPLLGIYTNLLYRYAVEPEFREEEGPFGFFDQFLATADFFNMLARLLSPNSIGSYEYDESWDRYQITSIDPNQQSSQLNIELGQGQHLGSVYQTGLTGIQRIERVGTFYSVFLATQFLTFRGLGALYDPDAIFLSNFYDLFPNETQQIFNGIISGRPENYRPRVRCESIDASRNCTNPEIVYMDFYRGDCSEGADASTCRANPIERYGDLDVINGSSFTSLRFLAAQWGLAQIPTFFDTTFQNQLFVCIEGQGDCTIPAEGAVEGVDFERYTSPRYGQTFLAWQVDSSLGVFEQTSIAFEMMREVRDSADILAALRAFRGENGGTPLDEDNISPELQARLDSIGYEIPDNLADIDNEVNRLDGRVRDLENTFYNLIQYQRIFGIQLPGLYTRPEL